MSDPLPPEATSPPAPRRVQFTMRTFFVAALWISAVFAAGRMLPTETAATCIGLFIVIGLGGIYHILQASSAKIAIAVGTAAMILGFMPLLLFERHLGSDMLFLVLICSMAWGVFFSILVGVARIFVLRVRRTKKKPWYCLWQQDTTWDEKPRSEAETMAAALVGIHFRWSTYILLFGWLLQLSLAVYSGESNVVVAIPVTATGLAPLDAPLLPLLFLIVDKCGGFRFSEPPAIALWTISNLFGSLLYLGLGYLIGRMLDSSEDARYTLAYSSSKASSPAKDPVKEPAVTADRETDRE